MTAPTEAEIRKAIAEAWIEPGVASSEARDANDQALFGLASEAERALYAVDDFRPSETAAAAVDEAVDQVLDGLAPLVAEALAKAFVTFAAEHPDAPRAREAVPA